MSQKKLLDKVFDIANQRLINNKPSSKIRKNFSPDQTAEIFDLSFKETGINDNEVISIIEKIVELSVDTSSPLFMNQMWGKVPATAAIGDLMSTLLNTSMYTYEVAPLMTLIEKECINALSSLVWSDTDCGDGVFTPGGSVSNINAMVLARNENDPASKERGTAKKVSIFISDQAHYSFKKGADYLGFGKESVVEVKSDKEGKIIIPELINVIEAEMEKGRIPLMLVGIAGSTALGAYDNLELLGNVASKYNLWFHVDAAYGGSLLFSKIYSSKLKGINHADSVTWNLHKILGMPLVCSVLLTRQKRVLNRAFSTSADYLYHENDYDYDLGQKSLQCGRRVDALKLWLAWKHGGTRGFRERVDKLVFMAMSFAQKVKLNSNFELLCEPSAPIVCFRYLPHNYLDININELNKKIRENIFNEGETLFNFITVKNEIFLRFVITSPTFSVKNIDFILKTIERHGKLILKESSVKYTMKV